ETTGNSRYGVHPDRCKSCTISEEGALVTFSLEAYVLAHYPKAKVSGDFLYIQCLYTDCRKADKLWINVKNVRPWYYCFRCQRSGDRLGFVALHRKITRLEARTVINGGAWQTPVLHPSDVLEIPWNLEPPVHFNCKSMLLPSVLPDAYRPVVPNGKTHLARLAYNYLLKRGVSDDQLTIYRIGYAETGKYTGHIIFPVTRDAEPVYFVARAFLSTHGGKYLNPSKREVPGGLGKGDVLFNYDRAKLATRITLVEGIFDALAVGWTAMALLGKT